MNHEQLPSVVKPFANTFCIMRVFAATNREQYSKEINRTQFLVHSGADMRYQWPLLRTKIEHAPPNPVTVTVDARNGLLDLKAQALELFSAQGRLEFSNLAADQVRLALVKPHLFNGAGGWHTDEILGKSAANIQNQLADGAELLLFNPADLPIHELPIGEDVSPIRLKITLLGPDVAKVNKFISAASIAVHDGGLLLIVYRPQVNKVPKEPTTRSRLWRSFSKVTHSGCPSIYQLSDWR